MTVRFWFLFLFDLDSLRVCTTSDVWKIRFTTDPSGHALPTDVLVEIRFWREVRTDFLSTFTGVGLAMFLTILCIVSSPVEPSVSLVLAQYGMVAHCRFSHSDQFGGRCQYQFTGILLSSCRAQEHNTNTRAWALTVGLPSAYSVHKML